MTGYSDAMQDSFFCPQRYPYKQWQPSASMIFYMFQLSETMERSSIKFVSKAEMTEADFFWI